MKDVAGRGISGMHTIPEPHKRSRKRNKKRLNYCDKFVKSLDRHVERYEEDDPYRHPRVYDNEDIKFFIESNFDVDL